MRPSGHGKKYMMIQPGETVFFDTNILLIATDSSRKNHKVAKQLFRSFIEKGYSIGISGQVIREYLVVATRPVSVNGLGLSPSQAVHNAEQFRNRCRFIEETRVSAALLQRLVVQYDLKGKRIHDANIVAAMRSLGIHHLLTENPGDFSCFNDISLSGLSDYFNLPFRNLST